jgi:hypothetical protein
LLAISTIQLTDGGPSVTPELPSCAADDVTNEGTDLRQLADVALQAKSNLAINQAEVLADAGYYNAAEVSRCTEHGLTPFIPKADTSANTKLGLYGKSQFQYDAAKDVYVCPANGTLTYRFSTYELGRELKYYRASGCKSCALKSRCTRNQANRTITREANEHLIPAFVAGSCAKSWPRERGQRRPGRACSPAERAEFGPAAKGGREPSTAPNRTKPHQKPPEIKIFAGPETLPCFAPTARTASGPEGVARPIRPFSLPAERPTFASG